ncbi:hypothetical protein SAMN05428945_5281 [Streptomyces sp. 2224.1]|nr:hypothetical protein SAMN05428945_5281 [Streptomyces sp. 2224.1]
MDGRRSRRLRDAQGSPPGRRGQEAPRRPEPAGRVVVVGADMDKGLVGRRVVVDPAICDSGGPDANPVGLRGSERDGGYAEYVTAPAERVHDVTESPLTDDQLATLPIAYGTALGVIERSRLQEGGDRAGLGSIRRSRPRAGADHPSARCKGACHQRRIHDRFGARGGCARSRRPGTRRRLTDPRYHPERHRRRTRHRRRGLVSEGLPLLREGGRWGVAGALGGYNVSFDVHRLHLHNAQVIGILEAHPRALRSPHGHGSPGRDDGRSTHRTHRDRAVFWAGRAGATPTHGAGGAFAATGVLMRPPSGNP